MSLPVTSSPQSGSILIIVVAIVLIVSVALTFGLGQLKTQDLFERSLETQRKMDRIAVELANYVHQHNRLPCPYFPYLDGGNLAAGRFSNMRTVLSGTESLDPSGAPGVCDVGVFGFPDRGILPFRTLNLNEDDVKDSWGRFFIYGISEVFSDTYFTRPAPAVGTMNLGPDNNVGQKGTTPARPLVTPAPAPPALDPSANNVMAACRTDGTAGGITSANRWVINARDDAASPVVGMNIHPQKALFCCSGRYAGNRDLVMASGKGSTYAQVDPSPYNLGGVNTIIGPFGTGFFQLRHTSSWVGFPALDDMDAPATPAGSAPVIGNTNSGNCPTRGCSTEGWAFVIASAGPDGVPQSTRGWPYGTIAYGGGGWSPSAVAINARYTGTHGTADDAYDDFVMMKTNFEVMNRLNSATCQTPFFSYQR